MKFRKKRRYRRREIRRRRTPVWKKTVPFVIALLLLLAAGAGTVFYVQNLRPESTSGMVRIQLEGDQMSLRWPSAKHMDICRLYMYDEDAQDYVLYGEYEGGEAVLSGIRSGQELDLRLEAVRILELFGKKYELPGYSRTLSVIPEELAGPELSMEADPQSRTMTIRWKAEDAMEYEVYLVDTEGNYQEIPQTEDGRLDLHFDGDRKLPDRDHPLRVVVRARKNEGEYMLYGLMSQAAVIERRELMSGELYLKWERIGDQQYALTWEEGTGDRYTLQQWSYRNQDWVTLKTYDWSAEMRYETGRLPSCTRVRYRVVSYDEGDGQDERSFTSEPSEAVFRTELSPLYCTIWPILQLNLLQDAQGGTAVDQIPAGTPLCVLAEENGRFRVRFKDNFGYVDSRYCMINLPEYLGNLCEYNIANSFSSIFRVHGYDIPEITDGVVKGYENVHLKSDDYLVPYLYPCSKKLYQAALRVEEDGYGLRIYDAFRPNEATRFLYDTVEGLLDEQVPEPEEEELQNEDNGLSANALEALGILSPEARIVLKGLSPEALSALWVLPTELLTGEFSATPPEALPETQAPAPFSARLKKDSAEGEVLSVSSPFGGYERGGRPLYETGQEGFLALEDGGVSDPADMSGEIGDDLPVPAAGTPELPPPGTEAVPSDEAGMVPQLPEEPGSIPLPPAGIFTPEQVEFYGGLSPEDQTAIRSLTPEEILLLKSLGEEELSALVLYLKENMLTYREVMTDNRYGLSSFLAAVTSAHNRGIALDLTLFSLNTGDSLEMQTDMHDLSWYSALAQNNENADLLAGYMQRAGFNDLSSEWWHFQDDDTRAEIGLNTYLATGVSVEGWKKDDAGWKYRRADGSYYQDTTVTVEGVNHTFDRDGYCTDMEE